MTYMKSMARILPFLAMAGMMDEAVTLRTRKRNFDTLEDLSYEYKLIQEKKSKLSRNQRDLVVAQVQQLIKEGRLAEDGSMIIKVYASTIGNCTHPSYRKVDGTVPYFQCINCGHISN